MNQYSLGLWDQRFWDCLQRCPMIEWWERGILRHEKSPLLEELAWWWEWSCQKLLLCQQPASPCQPYCSSQPHTQDRCLPSLSLLAKKVSSHSSTVHTFPYNRTSKIIYTLQQGWKSLLPSKLSILGFLSNSFIKTGWIKSFNCHRSKMFIAQ